MGRHRFKFSDMMPNAWLNRLKGMSRGGRNSGLSQATKRTEHRSAGCGSSATSQLAAPSQLLGSKPYQPGRASYYFPSGQPENLPTFPTHPRASDTMFPIVSPRKSQRKYRRKPAKLVSSSVSSACSCQTENGSVWRSEAVPEFPPALESPPCGDHQDMITYSDKPIIAEHSEFNGTAAFSRSCTTEIPVAGITVSTDGNPEPEALNEAPEVDLPPILTKPVTKRDSEPRELVGDGNAASKRKNFHKPIPCPAVKDQKSSQRRTPSGLQGLRMRMASPRLASKKLQLQAHHRHRKAAESAPRKFISESCAVVKKSSDPQRDFRDSMVEMIVENNLRTPKDLEELLVCYLSLNSVEYHDVIVKVFEQIWFDLTNVLRGL